MQTFSVFSLLKGEPRLSDFFVISSGSIRLKSITKKRRTLTSDSLSQISNSKALILLISFCFSMNLTIVWVLPPDVFVQSCLPTKLLSTILTNQKNPVVSAVNVLIEDANTFKSFLADLALVP